MLKGSHFTCRCATSVTFSGKVCFNPQEEEGREGQGALSGAWPGTTTILRFPEKQDREDEVDPCLVFLTLTKGIQYYVLHIIKYQIFWTHSGCIMTSPSSRQTYILCPMAPPIMLATAQALERKWNYDFFFGGKYKASHLSDMQARTQPLFCHNIQTEAIKPSEKYNTIHWTTASYYFPIHGQ